MKTTTVFEALKNESIAGIIKKDQSLTKHKVSVKFNAAGGSEPAGDGNWGFGTQQRKAQAMEENHVKVKGHIFGPQTARIGKQFAQFKASLDTPYEIDHDRELEIYIEMNLKVQKRNENVQKAVQVI